jgi:predicted aspartyl protease
LESAWEHEVVGSSGASERISFRVTEGHPLLLVEASINERGPYKLVIDTGASMTMISRRTARNARVARRAAPGAYALTAGGRSEVEIGRVEDLRVGSVRVRDVDVGIMTLAVISKAVGVRVDGVLGYNALNTFRLTIDYPGGYMLLDQSTQ